MAERIATIARPGAPGPALTESACERAWADFVGGRRDLEVAPVGPLLLDSWVRSRDVFHVEGAIQGLLITVTIFLGFAAAAVTSAIGRAVGVAAAG